MPRLPLFSQPQVKIAVSSRAIATLMLALLLVSGSIVVPRASSAQTERVATAPDSGIQPPDVSANAVYVYDVTAGVELYARNAD